MNKHSYLAFICCFILFILCLCACNTNAQQIVTTTEDVVQQTTARDDRKTALEASVSILKDIEKKSTVASQSNAASKVDEIQVEVTTTEQIYFDYDTLIPFEGTTEYYEEEIVETEVYEEPVVNYGGDVLSMESFYWMWYNMENVSYQDCLDLCANKYGMDEHQMLVALGWTVNEMYVYYDPYLAYLCGMCPLAFTRDAWTMANGLAGWDYSGMYSVDNLCWQGYNASQYDLNIFYLAMAYPQYGIFCCDGLSWYNDAWVVYESWCNGYIIRVWSY